MAGLCLKQSSSYEGLSGPNGHTLNGDNAVHILSLKAFIVFIHTKRKRSVCFLAHLCMPSQ